MSHFKLDWIEKYCEKPQVLFDIGSFDGKQAKIFKQNFPNALVAAFEADKNLFQKMSKNEKLNGIILENKAITDVDGELIFWSNTGKKRGSGSLHKPKKEIYKFDGMSFDEGNHVSCCRIDTFCESRKIYNIDVIHMDIQSAEYEALVGLGKIRPRLIFLEVSALNFYENTKSTTNLLIQMNYEKIDISEITKGDELWIKK